MAFYTIEMGNSGSGHENTPNAITQRVALRDRMIAVAYANRFWKPGGLMRDWVGVFGG